MQNPQHAIIVGCQRCGTTRLLCTLLEHPAVQGSVQIRPEPKYFLGGRDSNWNGSPCHYKQSVFGEVLPGTQVLLEKSASYLDSDDAATRISSMLPSARLVILIRNPVDRTDAAECVDESI
jgi:hypothetical protein